MLTLAALRRTHKRAEFDCGNEALNTYIRTQTSQDVRQNDANCYVLSDDDGDDIYGFFHTEQYQLGEEESGDQIRLLDSSGNSARSNGRFCVASTQGLR